MDERTSLNVLDSAKKLREGQERMLATMASVLGWFGSDSGSAAFAAAPHASQTFSHWFEPVKQALNALPDADQACLANITLEYASDILPVLQGTTACMPDGLTRSMEEEFKHNENGKWYSLFQYVVHQSAQELQENRANTAASGGAANISRVRDKGRTGWLLADFVEKVPAAQKARLTQAEVAAIRLYTSWWEKVGRLSRVINDALRTRDSSVIQPWATTVCILTGAIIKISELSSIDTVVYSGMPPCYFPALSTFCGNNAAESFVQHGFMPSSVDPEVLADYSGGKYTEGVVWVVIPTFSSRPADHSSLSMYPEEGELLFPPCTTLQIVAVERMETLNKYLVLARPHICTMRHYTEGLLYPWASPNDPLTHEEYTMVLEAEREKLDSSESAPGKLGGHVSDLITGEPKAAALGLEEYMKFDLSAALAHSSKLEAIEAEFKLAEDKTLDDGRTLWWWFDYVKNQPASSSEVRWGARDLGHDGMRLKDFWQTDEATKARLKEEHVMALRLYTCTPVSFALNAPLRNFKRDEHNKVLRPVSMCAEHSFPVTISVLNEAIKRLRDVEGKAVITLWRGLKNMDVSQDFLLAGGVEMAPMSTTYSLKTALFYSHSPNSIILKCVTRSFMERGANLSWISVFPGEQECLFPPVTYLSPTGRTQKVGKTFTIVEVTPRL